MAARLRKYVLGSVQLSVFMTTFYFSCDATGAISSMGISRSCIILNNSAPRPCTTVLPGLTSDSPNATSPPKFTKPLW